MISCGTVVRLYKNKRGKQWTIWWMREIWVFCCFCFSRISSTTTDSYILLIGGFKILIAQLKKILERYNTRTLLLLLFYNIICLTHTATAGLDQPFSCFYLCGYYFYEHSTKYSKAKTIKILFDRYAPNRSKISTKECESINKLAKQKYNSSNRKNNSVFLYRDINSRLLLYSCRFVQCHHLCCLLFVLLYGLLIKYSPSKLFWTTGTVVFLIQFEDLVSSLVKITMNLLLLAAPGFTIEINDLKWYWVDLGSL